MSRFYDKKCDKKKRISKERRINKYVVIRDLRTKQIVLLIMKNSSHDIA